MKKAICTLAALFTLSLTTFAQNKAQTPRYESAISPKTEVANVAAVTYTGVFVYNFTILLTSPITDPPSCTVSVVTTDAASGRQFEETAIGTASAPSGGYAKCTVKIYYSWALGSGGSDMVTGQYSVLGFTTNTVGTTERTASSNVVSFPVPANGTTTTTAISSRL
ncbi:hypothetical protein Acid345_0543 [Candidatus Koribacter versatilis Ellin345]|uniref:Lipoprotein n=1 Tax=Koribacter versatilis (strain Ellin345) TaxID=204669 RepID=Q1IUA2_KORVE|nr:hypothetical protein [Candidatus Koribacter versatilis]ABF39548.1 hypothetical protein Acid345_0543 [Candidatus Koribacter versatilis Ellin345]